MIDNFIPLIVFTPLIMSLILYSPFIADDEKIIRRVSKGFITIHFALTVLCSIFFNFSNPDFIIETDYQWIDVLGINANFAFDSLTMLFVILTSFIFLIAIYLSKSMIKKSYRLYYSLIFILLTAILGVFSAKDIFLFFLFWELELIPMYLLIQKWGSGNKQKTSMKFLLYTFFGSIFILLGFLILYYLNFKLTGTLSSDINDIDIISAPEVLRDLIFFLLLIGFGVKLPIIPLHGWLSDVHSQAPTPVSIILSSILLKLGAYGILRFNLQIFNYEFQVFAIYIMLFALINIIYASFCAIMQKDIKRIIAFSGIANMGIFLLGISSLNSIGITGGIFQLFSHAFISAGLFTIAGLIYIKCGTKNITRITGLGEKMPRLMFISIPILLASIGTPLLCGFIAEFLSFTGAFLLQTEGIFNAKALSLTALSVLIFSSIYILKIFHGVFFNTIKIKNRKISDINTKQLTILCLLTICIIIFGIFPFLLTDIIREYTNITYNPQGVF
ncbi:TPA: NADH-quinone oxidoreductase subunit M [Candidatus Avigastranaerophilus faecigallinarum]|nr:NADH-quinone oxidoreductase subunit M [Candidatus Avigastranaerophilus faecigallinarum]